MSSNKNPWSSSDHFQRPCLNHLTQRTSALIQHKWSSSRQHNTAVKTSRRASTRAQQSPSQWQQVTRRRSHQVRRQRNQRRLQPHQRKSRVNRTGLHDRMQSLQQKQRQRLHPQRSHEVHQHQQHQQQIQSSHQHSSSTTHAMTAPDQSQWL